MEDLKKSVEWDNEMYEAGFEDGRRGMWILFAVPTTIAILIAIYTFFA